MSNPIRIRATRTVPAPAARVYDILADYRSGHPQILPARVFRELRIERGGRGAGTVIHVGMKAFGSTKRFRAEITEPEPGKVLVERELEGHGVVTTFTVRPDGAADRTAVTIETCWSSSGAAGFFERLLARPFLRRLYKEQLFNLEKVATGSL